MCLCSFEHHSLLVRVSIPYLHLRRSCNTTNIGNRNIGQKPGIRRRSTGSVENLRLASSQLPQRRWICCSGRVEIGCADPV